MQCRRHGFDPWVGKTPGKGNGNLLQNSCLGNPTDLCQRSLATPPWGHKRVGHHLATKQLQILGEFTVFGKIRLLFHQKWCHESELFGHIFGHLWAALSKTVIEFPSLK